MVFKIISVGSIPAALVIFSACKISFVKNKSKSRKVKTNQYTKKRLINFLNSNNYLNPASASNSFNNELALSTSTPLPPQRGLGFCYSHYICYYKHFNLVTIHFKLGYVLPDSPNVVPYFTDTWYTTMLFTNIKNFTPGMITDYYIYNTNSRLSLFAKSPNELHLILDSWLYMKVIRFISKHIFKSRLLGVYVTGKLAFFINSIFSPSVENIKTFQNLLYERLTTSFDELLYSNKKLFLHRTNIFISKYNFLRQTVNVNDKNIKKHLNLFSSLVRLSSKFSKKNFYLFYKFYNKRKYRRGYFLKRFKRGLKTFKKVALRRLSYKLFHLNNINCTHTMRGVFNSKVLCLPPNFLKTKAQYFKHIMSVKNSPSPFEAQKALSFFFVPLKNNVPAYLNKLFFIFNINYFLFLHKLLYQLSYPWLKQQYLLSCETNLVPNVSTFVKKINKYIHAAKLNYFFRENVTPWVFNTLTRFIEFYSGRKVLISLYSFMSQSIDTNYVVLYKSWLSRFAYYERRLGHRFFLEESLHILHMGFNYHDSKLISSWLKSLIQRISFWKTRFIFRFIKYLFTNCFQYLFKEIQIKGFKIKLKGKISVAGNSRKRCILYRIGKTSHSTSGLKVVHTTDTIVTFTGVMGFQIWIFY